MNSRKLPPFLPILWISLLLSLVGWLGLAFLIFETLPYLAPRWLFFFFLMLGLSGTSLPILYFINWRFPLNAFTSGNVLVREAVMVGLYGCVLTWLQIGRMLSPLLTAILAVALLLIELLLRLREGSQWSPAPGASGHPGEEMHRKHE